jgi:hypothetical protein
LRWKRRWKGDPGRHPFRSKNWGMRRGKGAKECGRKGKGGGRGGTRGLGLNFLIF